MPSNFPRYALAALVATISSTGAITAASAQEKSYDVVVYGGTSGGVVAAVQAALAPSIEKQSVGLAVQAGFDVMLDPRWSINLDIKKLKMDTEVRSKGASVGKFKIDPLLIGVGVGYRF